MSENTYSIGQVAELTHLSTHTLRYYEKEGLICPQRSTSGLRIYDDVDLGAIRFITCMKNTGMSIADIAHFAELSRENNQESIDERIALLRKHEQLLQARIKDLEKNLDYVRHKIAWYQDPENHERPAVPEQKAMTETAYA